MRVLLVEDNDQKARQIQELLNEFSPEILFHAKSLRATYPALERGGWTVVILDMTLHASEGQWASSAKESLAGLEVLQAISASQDQCRVIVATQHDIFRQEPLYFQSVAELDSALGEWFAENYAGIVRVTLGREEWKSQLRELLQSTLVKSSSRGKNGND